MGYALGSLTCSNRFGVLDQRPETQYTNRSINISGVELFSSELLLNEYRKFFTSFKAWMSSSG